jgi:hypothetical protein
VGLLSAAKVPYAGMPLPISFRRGNGHRCSPRESTHYAISCITKIKNQSPNLRRATGTKPKNPAHKISNDGSGVAIEENKFVTELTCVLRASAP